MISASCALAQVPGAPGGEAGFPGGPATAPAPLPPTTQPALLKEAQDGLQKIVDAVQSGNAEELKNAVQAKTDAQKKAAENFAKLNAAAVNLFKATETKFGKEALAKADVSLERFPVAFPPLDPKNYVDVKLDGPSVMLVPAPDSGYPELTLVKEDGKYKLDSSLIPTSEEEAGGAESPRDRMFGVMQQELANTNEDVVAGKFRAADEVLPILNVRLQRAMRTLQQEMMEKAFRDQMKRQAEAAGASTQPAGPPVPVPAPTAPAQNDVLPNK